jgi:hypothetical protein
MANVSVIPRNRIINIFLKSFSSPEFLDRTTSFEDKKPRFMVYLLFDAKKRI